MPNQRLTTLTELQHIPKGKDVMDIIKSKEGNDIFLRTISAAVIIINETHQPFHYYRHCSNIKQHLCKKCNYCYSSAKTSGVNLRSNYG